MLKEIDGKLPCFEQPQRTQTIDSFCRKTMLKEIDENLPCFERIRRHDIAIFNPVCVYDYVRLCFISYWLNNDRLIRYFWYKVGST
jgi:hypothetical protein